MSPDLVSFDGARAQVSQPGQSAPSPSMALALGAGEGLPQDQAGPVEERLVSAPQLRLPVVGLGGPILPGPSRALVPHQPGKATPRSEPRLLYASGHSVSFPYLSII